MVVVLDCGDGCGGDAGMTPNDQMVFGSRLKTGLLHCKGFIRLAVDCGEWLVDPTVYLDRLIVDIVIMNPTWWRISKRFSAL